MLPKNSRNQARTRGQRRGTAIVEMALVVVILLMLTMGLIQWGMIFNASISVTNLSREAARYAAVFPETDAAIVKYVKDNSPPSIKKEDLTVTVFPPEGDATRLEKGQAIHVIVEYNMARKLFLPSKMTFPGLGASNPPTLTFFSGLYRAEGHMMIEG